MRPVELYAFTEDKKLITLRSEAGGVITTYEAIAQYGFDKSESQQSGGYLSPADEALPIWKVIKTVEDTNTGRTDQFRPYDVVADKFIGDAYNVVFTEMQNPAFYSYV